MNKIITLENFKKKGLYKKYKNIVLAHGVFDVLHIGHLRYFKKAKSLGDCLIVSVTNDKDVNKGINRPFFNEHLRLEAISQIECVNYVILSKEKTSPPDDIEKFYVDNVAKKIKQEFLKVLS